MPKKTKKGPWRAAEDKTTGRTYYYNKKTKETSWVMPEELRLRLEAQEAEKVQAVDYARLPSKAESAKAHKVQPAAQEEPKQATPEYVQPTAQAQATAPRKKPVALAAIATAAIGIVGEPDPQPAAILEPDVLEPGTPIRTHGGGALPLGLAAGLSQVSEYDEPDLDLPPPPEDHPSAGSPLRKLSADQRVSGECQLCHRAIMGPPLTVGGKRYHGACLVCGTGQHPLGPSFEYHQHNGKLYCPKHYAQASAQTCSKCQAKIIGQHVQVGDSYYHPTCWTCRDCSKQLTLEDHAQHKGWFYCPDCHRKALMSGGSDEKGQAALLKLQRHLAGLKAKKAMSQKKEARMLKPGETFSLDVLQADVDLPMNMDKGKKEDYLSDADFVLHFKISREKFAAMAKWKRDKIKKGLKIF